MMTSTRSSTRWRTRFALVGSLLLLLSTIDAFVSPLHRNHREIAFVIPSEENYLGNPKTPFVVVTHRRRREVSLRSAEEDESETTTLRSRPRRFVSKVKNLAKKPFKWLLQKNGTPVENVGDAFKDTEAKVEEESVLESVTVKDEPTTIPLASEVLDSESSAEEAVANDEQDDEDEDPEIVAEKVLVALDSLPAVDHPTTLEQADMTNEEAFLQATEYDDDLEDALDESDDEDPQVVAEKVLVALESLPAVDDATILQSESSIEEDGVLEEEAPSDVDEFETDEDPEMVAERVLVALESLPAVDHPETLDDEPEHGETMELVAEASEDLADDVDEDPEMVAEIVLAALESLPAVDHPETLEDEPEHGETMELADASEDLADDGDEDPEMVAERVLVALESLPAVDHPETLEAETVDDEPERGETMELAEDSSEDLADGEDDDPETVAERVLVALESLPAVDHPETLESDDEPEHVETMEIAEDSSEKLPDDEDDEDEDPEVVAERVLVALESLPAVDHPETLESETGGDEPEHGDEIAMASSEDLSDDNDDYDVDEDPEMVAEKVLVALESLPAVDDPETLGSEQVAEERRRGEEETEVSSKGLAEPENNLVEVRTEKVLDTSESLPAVDRPAVLESEMMADADLLGSTEEGESVSAGSEETKDLVSDSRKGVKDVLLGAATRSALSAVAPPGDRWAVGAADTDLSGTWIPIMTDEFKDEYDDYLRRLGQPMLVRSVAVSIVGMTREEIDQRENGKEIVIKGQNVRGMWERTLIASGAVIGTPDFEPEMVSIVTADGERVESEAWWEEGGKVHVSWQYGTTRYGGGSFEAKRYLEESGDVLVSKVTFHPNDESREKAVVTWRFHRDR